MDVFSEILAGVKLKGAVFFRADLSAPWEHASPKSEALAPALAPGSPHLVIYHLVVEGAARVGLDTGEALALSAGEVVVFPHGDAHWLTGGIGGNRINAADVLQKLENHDLTPLCTGGGGAVTRLLCGYAVCDPLLCAPILTALPPMLKVDIRTNPAGQWLENAILQVAEETCRKAPGSEAMLAKLSEALFIEILRQHVAQSPDAHTGWLSAAKDPAVGKSIAILHGRAAHPWTIAKLASEVGISRTTLVERFSKSMGEPPMAYLTRWRMRLAARALLETSRGLSEVAADVGYHSEAAFNRAFRREFGDSPARYRRAHQQSPQPTSPSPR